MKWRAIMAMSAVGLFVPGAAMVQSEEHSEGERVEVHQMETMEVRPRRVSSSEEGTSRPKRRFLDAPRSFVPELLESVDEL